MLIGELYHFPKPVFSNLEVLLDFLFRQNQKEPLILVLDEYPYLREAVKGLDSILQALIDKYRDSKFHPRIFFIDNPPRRCYAKS